MPRGQAFGQQRAWGSLPPRPVWWLVALALAPLAWGLTPAATAQTTPPSAAPPSAAPTGTVEIALEDPPAPFDLAEQIDGVFTRAVDWLEKVLLYRVASTTQETLTFTHKDVYVRDRGSDAPFTRLEPLTPAHVQTFETLPLAGAQALLDEGRVEPGRDEQGRPRAYRWGRLNDRAIEYVTVKIDVTTRYLWQAADQKFHKLLPMRGLVSVDDTLTREAAEALVAKGEARSSVQTDPGSGIPLVVLWLGTGAVCFTIYFGAFNVRGFVHAVNVVRGKYDNPAEAGEVTHAQALASALSATVGLGNIAGVTTAMATGGPGAFFWMALCGVFGMTSKFLECTLGVKYRQVKPDGSIQGGPMRYLRIGLAERGLGPLGAGLALVFTVMCILGSFGGGNMYQANQSGAALLAVWQQDETDQLFKLSSKHHELVDAGKFDEARALEPEIEAIRQHRDRQGREIRFVFGMVLAIATAVVILGGIKRIAATAEKIVPLMCAIYIVACLYIILSHYADVPALVAQIFSEAFTGRALGGGALGAAVIGVQRAAFSNEAGVGSASIAHSAAKTDEPVREGVVALLEPFIDTVVVCSMTGLVILITGAWDNKAWIVDLGLSGSALTSQAFRTELSWFPIVLAVATILFAYSTIISWSYYGERCWEELFGPRSTVLYRVLSIACVFVGSIVNLGSVLAFSDMMILSMAFPNIVGLAILAPSIRVDLAEYWRKYKAGEFQAYH